MHKSWWHINSATVFTINNADIPLGHIHSTTCITTESELLETGKGSSVSWTVACSKTAVVVANLSHLIPHLPVELTDFSHYLEKPQLFHMNFLSLELHLAWQKLLIPLLAVWLQGPWRVGGTGVGR